MHSLPGLPRPMVGLETHMKSFAKMFGAAMFGAYLLGTPLLAQTINIDYDHSVDFKQYKSYHWEKVHASDPDVEQRINLALDRDLNTLSLHEVDSKGKPGLFVTAVEATKSSQEYVDFYKSIASFVSHRSWGSGGFSDSVARVGQIPVGTLVLDMYDGKTHKLVWRGTAEEAISRSTDKNDDSMDKAINTMLDRFPPKGEK